MTQYIRLNVHDSVFYDFMIPIYVSTLYEFMYTTPILQLMYTALKWIALRLRQEQLHAQNMFTA